MPVSPGAAEADVVRTRVNEALDRFLDRQEHHFDAIVADPKSRSQWQDVLNSLREFLGRGKRLRPVFCYWGWRGAGGEQDSEGIVTAAAALELLHAFALIHDDLIDQSDTRRGAPSLHRRHASLHRESGRKGSAELYGKSVALLLGDLCLGWFHEMLGRSGLPIERLHAARELVSLGFTELVLGQYLDVAEQAEPAYSVERATTVIQYKTAKYTVERPLHLGGMLAGASSDLLKSYSAYALPLGEAFQLRDDVLGAFGNPSLTGKPVADDLRARKPTVLLATARRSATPASAAEIDHLFTVPELAEHQVCRLQAIIADSGALAECEHRIERLVVLANEALREMPVAPEIRDNLAELIASATERAS